MHPFLFSIRNERLQVSVHAMERISRLMRTPQFKPAPVDPVILDEARRWNEIWWPLASMLIVREDVAAAMETAGLRGLRWANVNIVDVTERLSLDQAPAYRCLLPKAGIEVDISRVAFNDRDRATRGQSDPGAPAKTRFVPIRDTWNGADLVVCGNHPTLHIWCTLRVVELARKLKWKGLCFCPMDVPSDAKITFNRGAGVAYMQKQWPPQWYPDQISPASENLVSSDEE